jgi:GNAT superfamily N-acetyltransferase
VKLAIRPMSESEAPLVLDSWTRTLEDGGRPMRVPSTGAGNYVRVGRDAHLVAWQWYQMHRDWVRLALPGLTVAVATLAGSDEALGWVAYVPPGDHPLVVHYVYAIDVARRRGVGLSLLQHAASHADDRGLRVSHTTPRGLRLLERMTSRTNGASQHEGPSWRRSASANLG